VSIEERARGRETRVHKGEIMARLFSVPLVLAIAVSALALPGASAAGVADASEPPTALWKAKAAEDPRHEADDVADGYEAEAASAWQTAAGGAAAEIRDLYPDAFVAARATPTSFTVVFVRAAPEGALRMLSDVPVDVQIVERTGIPEVTMLKTVDAVTSAVAPLAAATEGFSISPDPESGSIGVELYPMGGTAEAERSIQGFEKAVRDAVASLDAPGATISIRTRATPGGVDTASDDHV